MQLFVLCGLALAELQSATLRSGITSDDEAVIHRPQLTVRMIYAGKEVSLFCGHVFVLSVSHGIACDYSRSRAKATRSVTSGFMDLTGAIASSNLADCPRHSRLFGRRTRRGASTSAPPHNARRRRVKSSQVA